MSNERVAIDTNILLYVLSGDRAAHALLKGREVVASAMIRMEAMVYHGKDEAHLDHVHAFIRRCEVVEIHRSVQDIAVDLRLRYKLKIPDAIIAATAVHLRIPLITADQIFARSDPEYEVVLYNK